MRGKTAMQSILSAIILFASCAFACVEDPTETAAIPQPREEIARFMQTNPPAKEDNGYYAYAGLTAPANVEDFHTFGFKHAARKGDEYDYESWEDSALEFDKNGFVFCDSFGHIQEKWQCPDLEDIKELEVRNQLILSRYKQLYKYPHFYSKALQSIIAGQDGIAINRFLANKWILEARAGRSGAEIFQEWRDNMLLQQRFISGRSSFLDKNIFVVNIYTNQKALLHMLYARPEIAKSYRNEINYILDVSAFDEERGFDVVEGVKQELALAAAVEKFYKRKNYEGTEIKSGDVYKEVDELAQDFIWLSKQPAHQMIAKMDEIAKKTRKHLHTKENFAAHMLSTVILIPMAKEQEMRARMLRIYVNGIAEGVAAQNAGEYIASQPPELQNEFTGKPFLWDAEKGTMYYNHIIDENLRGFEIKW